MSAGTISNRKGSMKFTSPGPVVVETYTSSTTWTCPAGVTEVFCIAVGGGGGGGSSGAGYVAAGGGGGAGELVTASLAVVPGQAYNITIGAGGNAGTVPWASGLVSNGSTTSFGKQIWAAGGGQGGGTTGDLIPPAGAAAGKHGGNGGGGNYVGYAFSSNGFNGGTNSGGGAGGAGSGYTAGASVYVLKRTPSGRTENTPASVYLGGGGGGGYGYHDTSTGNAGGTSSGATGGRWTYIASVWAYVDPTSATANTGGGGGGCAAISNGYYEPGKAGSAGAAGVVILVYDRSPI